MNSIAAAKRRRAGIQPNTPPVNTAPVNTPAPAQQPKINLLEYLTNIEKRMKDLESNTKPSDANFDNIQLEIETAEGKTQVSITDYMESMDARFQMFAEEIALVKDTVLKLQSYTMEVNQKLLHEITSGSFYEKQQQLSPENRELEREISRELKQEEVVNELTHENVEHEEEDEKLEIDTNIDISNNDIEDVEIIYGGKQTKKRKNNKK